MRGSINFNCSSSNTPITSSSSRYFISKRQIHNHAGKGTPYFSMYNEAKDDPRSFWGTQAKEIPWYNEPSNDNILDTSNPPFYKWYTDGVMNTSYCCLDYHIENGRSDQVALIHHSAYGDYGGDVTKSIATKYSYSELLARVEKVANVLKNKGGVKKGDRVIIYMPAIPETVISMLACARIGAVHSVVFGGFASRELATRIDDAKPVAIISASCGLEPGGKIVQYKPLLDGALELSSWANDKEKGNKEIPCFIVSRPEQPLSDLKMKPGRDFDFRMLEKEAPETCVPVPVVSTDPLYILYTSGTTGAPKGVVRDNGGHAVALKFAMEYVFKCPPGAVFFCASDLGWVVGHSFIAYGPLLQGSTTVLFEGKPVGTPDAGTYWRIAEEHNVHTLFTAPTALRAIKAQDPAGCLLQPEKHLKSLSALWVAGERADPHTMKHFQHTTRKPVLDNWWQTETGWPAGAYPLGMLGDGKVESRNGSCTFAVPGYDLRCLDDDGLEVPVGNLGQLAFKLPMPPGTLTTLYNADDRFLEAYLSKFPGYYDCSDSGFIDAAGYVHVMSRTDDVINVAGHRLSTSALEEVLINAHPSVVECAVVGISDEEKGSLPVGVIVLSDSTNVGRDESYDSIKATCVAQIRADIGPVAAFKRVVAVKSLPKTRSGKILRRTLKAALEGVPRADLPIPPTIENIDSIDHIITAVELEQQ